MYDVFYKNVRLIFDLVILEPDDGFEAAENSATELVLVILRSKISIIRSECIACNETNIRHLDEAVPRSRWPNQKSLFYSLKS